MSSRRSWISPLLPSLAVLALGATLAWGGGQEQPQQPPPQKAKLDEKAPDFTLLDSKGEQHKLSDYKGSIVVLEWTDTECPIVQRHYDQSRSMHETYKAVLALDKNAVWLAVNSTRNATAKKMEFWISLHDVEYPILLDPEGEVGRLYDARLAPEMFIIDKEGVLRYRGAIDSNRSGFVPKDEIERYVVDAVRQIVAGDPVRPKKTKPYGCSIKYKR
jgi:peroxiredoxin